MKLPMLGLFPACWEGCGGEGEGVGVEGGGESVSVEGRGGSDDMTGEEWGDWVGVVVVLVWWLWLLLWGGVGLGALGKDVGGW